MGEPGQITLGARNRLRRERAPRFIRPRSCSRRELDHRAKKSFTIRGSIRAKSFTKTRRRDGSWRLCTCHFLKSMTSTPRGWRCGSFP